MRRLSEHQDRGIATLFVVLITPVLILFGTFVFDGGRGIVARGQVQGAADAGALAKATDCATQVTSTAFGAYQTNGAVLANVPTCGSGTTTVSMKQTITSMFPLGTGPWVVTRSATANWGTLGSATTVPITISSCEFTQALLDGTTDIVLYLDDPKPQTSGSCPSLPGGFSQLVNDNCAVAVTAGGMVAGSPGGDVQKEIACITNPTSPTLPHDALVPIYDTAACQAADCKGHGPYKILGFAMLHVTGYSFNGSNFAGSLGKKCPDESRGKYCIQGDFVRFVTSAGTPGPSSNFGVTSVYLFS